MSDEIRVGDRFLVEVEVMDPQQDFDRSALCRLPDGYSAYISRPAILASKRLFRTIKVGDRVISGDWLHPLKVEWLDTEQALLRTDNGTLTLELVASLAPADGETA